MLADPLPSLDEGERRSLAAYYFALVNGLAVIWLIDPSIVPSGGQLGRLLPRLVGRSGCRRPGLRALVAMLPPPKAGIRAVHDDASLSSWDGRSSRRCCRSSSTGRRDAGIGVASLAAPVAVGGPAAAASPVIAVACSSVAVGTLIINRFARLLRPAVHGTSGPTPVALDGIPAVAFVSKEYTARWVSATVFRLASEGMIAVVDERRPVLQSWDEAVEHIQLEFTGDSTAVGARAVARRCGLRGRVRTVRQFAAAWSTDGGPPDRSDGDRAGRHGGSPRQASRSAVRRRGADGARFAQAAGMAGIALGFSAAAGPGHTRAPSSSDGSRSWLGAGALIGSVLILRMRMLNADGIALRDGVARRREVLEESTFGSVTLGERVLPWAVMFDLPSLAERLGAVAKRSGISPQWYRSDAPFSAARFVSCVEAVQLRMMPRARFAVSDPGGFIALYAWQVGGGDGGGGFGGFGDGGGSSAAATSMAVAETVVAAGTVVEEIDPGVYAGRRFSRT